MKRLQRRVGCVYISARLWSLVFVGVSAGNEASVTPVIYLLLSGPAVASCYPGMLSSLHIFCYN